MYSSTDITVCLRDHLAFQYVIANLNQRFGDGTDMLVQGNRQLRRQRTGKDRLLVGFALVAGRFEATMKGKQRAHAVA